MTRTSGSVPDGRSSTRPESPSSATDGGDGIRHALHREPARERSTSVTLTSTCG